MSATGWRAGGGMGWSPYDKSGLRPSLNEWIRMTKGLSNKQKWKFAGSWKHNPLHTYWTAFKGANLATTIGQGNFMTRDYRQKPIVGLQKAEHKRRVSPMVGAKPSLATLYEQVQVSNPRTVAIPMVSRRRTKNYKNIFLATSKAMPYRSKKTYRKRTKKSYKKATNSKNKKKYSKKPKSVMKVLKTEVNKLKKAVNVAKATHTFKTCSSTYLKSLIGRCNHTALYDVSLSELELACANLRYYDPSAPATLTTANANTGTYARDVYFKSYHTKVEMRNNYQVPVRVKVYHCKVKNDCNETPLTTYTTAITDQVINAGVDETDQLIHLTDIERVREVWKVDCVVDRVLSPGQEASTSNTSGPFNFDPSHIDSFTNIFQQTFKGSCYIVRIEGVLGHDTAVAEYSLLPAGVDIQVYRKAVIEYEAGVDLDDIYITDNRVQSFTNGGVVSLEPVADNIAYSVS